MTFIPLLIQSCFVLIISIQTIQLQHLQSADKEAMGTYSNI